MRVGIIGIACRFPGADNPRDFWNNLVAGVDSIREIPPERWDTRRYYSPNIGEANKANSKWCGLIEDIDQFDQRFFGISPREAKNMDPQQRIVLEETWHCIEDSGIALTTLQQAKTAVYVGVMGNDYQIASCTATIPTDSYAALGNYHSILANRISYAFGLNGASQSINTACSASLVALHQAKAALRAGEADYAIVAGVNLNIHPWKYISFSKSRMLSPDGHCKTFDKDADGYVPGDGVGVLLLQPLENALQAENHVYGVVRGSAVNHVGRALSITAPRVEAQRDVILAAYADGDLQPTMVSYVEAHGTGTSLGDPIEIEALTRAFRAHTQANHFCHIGSVKSNIGHLEAAAGVAGVIKVLLMMEQRQIVPSLNIRTPNPVIDFDESPFILARELQQWSSDGPLSAGVSSFGFGGVNSHVVIAACDEQTPTSKHFNTPLLQPPYVFVLSAKSASALQSTLSHWHQFIHETDFQNRELRDICATVATTRSAFSHRFGALVNNHQEIAESIQQACSTSLNDRPWEIHFDAWGDNPQQVADDPPARHKAVLESLGDKALVELLRVSGDDAMPSAFIWTYAYLQALLRLGFKPVSVSGEKDGLWLALVCSGMLCIDDALAVLSGSRPIAQLVVRRPCLPFLDPVTQQTLLPYQFDATYLALLLDGLKIDQANLIRNVERARLLQESQFTFKKYLDEWSVLLAKFGEQSLDDMLDTLVHTAQDDSQQNKALLMLILGSASQQLDKKWDLTSRPDVQSEAFQELLDLILDGVLPKEMVIELFSISGETDLDAAGAILNERQGHMSADRPYRLIAEYSRDCPVIPEFETWLARALDTECRLPSLTSTNRLVLSDAGSEQDVVEQVGVQLVLSPRAYVPESLLKLWLHGVPVEWQLVYPTGAFRKLPLPTYRFERSAFWIETMQRDEDQQEARQTTESEPIEETQSHALYHRLFWREQPEPLMDDRSRGPRALIFSDREGVAEALAQQHVQAAIVKPASAYARVGKDSYRIDIVKEQDYARILALDVEVVYYLWGITRYEIEDLGAFTAYQEHVIMPMFRLCRVLARHSKPLRLVVVSRQLHQVSGSESTLFPYAAPMLGTAKVLGRENPLIDVQCIDIPLSWTPRDIDLLARETSCPPFHEIAYRHGKRFIKTITTSSRLPASEEEPVVFKPGGVYLIVGGLGGIGFALSCYLTEHYRARLVLVGRSLLNREKEQQIETLQQLGGEVLYVNGDGSKLEDMTRAVQAAKERFGALHGCIHSALVMASGLLEDMTEAIFRQGLEPKSKGSYALHRATLGEHLDFLLFFSSFITFRGDQGVANYAAGCAFQDAFAHYLRTDCRRPGFVINWGHWGEIGIAANARFKQIIEKLDVDTLSTQQGLAGLSAVLAGEETQVMVARLGQTWTASCPADTVIKQSTSKQINALSQENSMTRQPPGTPKQQRKPDLTREQEPDRQRLLDMVVGIAAEALNVSEQDIGLDERFSEMGVDSILGVELVNKINERLGELVLNPTTIFDYPNVGRLVDYILDQSPRALEHAMPETAQAPKSAPKSAQESAQEFWSEERSQDTLEPTTQAHETRLRREDDIAVIGMSGQFPGANNVLEFWEIIAAGKNSISEVPASRWSLDEYYDPDWSAPNKTYCRHGGYLADIDKFDPLFFSISPKEAELMDPQQRLFLEHSWRAIEDAGYTAKGLSGQRVDIYVGIKHSEYFTDIVQSQYEMDAHVFLGNDAAILSARLAYFMDLNGPALAIDTACSSSLVAIHQACQQLRTGQVDVALAGGVMVMPTPQIHIMASKAGMLSPSGQCRTFDRDADGFVPAEGVGVLVLKPLAKAIEDNDHIYGVVKGSGINQDGKTNGITAPSTLSQSRLLLDVYGQAGIDPTTIGYVEAHGTGTKLGDPIEVTALTRAYQEYTDATQYCAIGSVKANIGHTQYAAGVAGVIKVLLAFERQQLPPAVNYQHPNEHIDFTKTPFYVNTRLRSWDSVGQPRRAAVSSFGFSGTNAHLVIEEFTRPGPVAEDSAQQPYLFLLSAKDAERLQDYARELRDFLVLRPETAMSELTYTLQVGREAMTERLAVVASSVDELVESLAAFVEDPAHVKGFRGNAAKDATQTRLLLDGAAGEAFLQVALEQRELGRLAQMWVSGVDIDWLLLYGENRPRRISLPTYPFARESYWIAPLGGSAQQTTRQITGQIAGARRHPLIDHIEPSLSYANPGLVFIKTIKPHDWIVNDHIVSGSPAFPGVGYLEMALAATLSIHAQARLGFRRVLWQQPLVIDTEPKTLRVHIVDQDGEMRYAIRDSEKLYATGLLTANRQPIAGSMDIEGVRSRCRNRLDKAAFYRRFAATGVHFGPRFQGVQEVWANAGEALARLALPIEASRESRAYRLHPSLMDSALQTVMAIGEGPRSSGPLVPFSMEQIELSGPLQADMYAYAKVDGEQRFQVLLLDNAGRVCVSCRDFVLRALPDRLSSFFYLPRWIARGTTGADQMPMGSPQSVLIVTGVTPLRLERAISACLPSADVRYLYLGTTTQALAEGHWEIEVTNPGAFDQHPQALGEPDCIYFLGGIQIEPIRLDDLSALEVAQQRGVLALFRLVKALIRHGLIKRRLQLKVLTNEVFQVRAGDRIKPFAAGLYGLSRALEKEYQNLDVSCIDLDLSQLATSDRDELVSALLPATRELPADNRAIAWRDGQCYTQCLIQTRLSATEHVPFRKRGVYVILGGAGGIGLQFSRYLANAVEARLVLIGRRELSEIPRADLEAIEQDGGQVLYLSADATNSSSMQAAIDQAKARFGCINGVVHSAIALHDRTLDNMDEETFRAALAPKVEGSLVLYQVLRHEPLDFMLFFSSSQSYWCNAGQSNYAAACTFKDAFANALAQASPCPVAIVNWGYWGDVGIVAKDAYRKRLAAQGFRSISSEEGMDAVRRVLHHGVQQVMAIHASDDILSDMGVQLGDEIVVYPRMQPSLFDHPLLDQLVPWLDRPAISSEQLLENDRASGELTRFGHDLVVDALQRMGVFLRSGEHYVRSTLTQQLNLAPAYHRLWEVLLETLLDAGFIEYVAADDGLVTTDKVVSLEAKRKTGELQQSKQRLQAAYPSMSARIDLLWNCVSAYPDVLTGRVGHMEALFPRGSMELVEGVYKDDPLSIYYNRLLGALVQQFIPLRLQQDQHTPISILEVGAGTGGSSSLVLAAIAKHAQQVRYIYTDISIGFTQYGERCFGQDYPFVEFKPLDIEKDPVAQGFSPGSIDLLFGTNVFHATRRIHNTVNNAKRLLKRNGLLVLNEITRRQEFTTLTFGLTDGWWLFEDEEVRCPGSPLLSVQQWTRVLQDCGLGSIHAVGLPDHTQEDQPQCVIVAESDGEVRLQKARDRLQGNVDVEPVPQAPAMPAIPVAAETNRVDLTGETLDYVRGVFADLLKVDRDRLDVESTFERYGVDSLVVLELNRRLEQDFGRLPATLLFERKTIAAVADYLVSEHRSVLEERHRSPDIESSGVHTQPIEERTCAERGRHNEKLDDADLSEQALDYVKSVFSDVLKIDREKLDVDTTLEVYGVDSLVVLEINRRLEDGLGRLPSTLLFEQNTMQALSEYLLKAKSAELQLLLGPSPQASMLDGGNILKHAVGERANPVGDVSDPVKDNMARQGSSVSEPCHQERETGPIQSDPAQSNPAQSNPVQSDMNIAIIGMTGRYPGAESLEQFWENLRSGKNCIREIPTERWRWQEYDEGESDQSRSGGSYTRWGGFIDDVDKFDPLFFGISPREAEEMDPQERLFLETVWALLEDAGYTRDKVVEMDQKVGTFVGVMNNDYEWVGAKASTGGTYVDAHSAYWSIANRISYFYDFTGPSLAVDTACSSSLTALHLACQSLKRGECDVSIVGAVNLILHPKHYLRLCQMKMLAADDRCKSFGEGGDGFVDGEGVGAVLLKPLAQALADGDNVLGVIKASNINASGKTSGYTVPNPNTQAALIEETLRIGGIDPRTIGYVEAHGTGTALGDPIEISGLTQAYRAFTSDRHYCAIGSVKSNVGHLESAAGLVGLTKVVLSMQHQQLVPSLHSERRNEHIDFEESPFYVQQELAPWHEPVIREDGREIRHPRRAGISSFGAGGANAHVILEEYHSPDERCSQIEGDRQLIVLSARNQERLEAVVDRLIDFLSRHWQEPEDAQAGRTLWARNLSLANLAYTLQTAREAMAERLAFTAQSIPQAIERLVRYKERGAEGSGCYTGSAKQSSFGADRLIKGKAGEAFLRAALEEQEYDRLAQLWVSGVDIDWTLLPRGAQVRRISLPTYPFARQRYWAAQADGLVETVAGQNAAGSPGGLHPLLDRNDSTLQAQCYSKLLRGDEFYLTDHRIAGQKTLPGVAYLEMAWAAGELAQPGTTIRGLHQIVWARPISVDHEAVTARIELYPLASGQVAFEITTEDAMGQAQIHAQGRLEYATADAGPATPEPRQFDLEAIRARSSEQVSQASCYARFATTQLDYGAHFQAIHWLWRNDEEALARLQLPDQVQHGLASFTFHPALLDGALQTVTGYMGQSTDPTPYLPFALEHIERLGPLGATGYAYVRRAAEGQPATDAGTIKFNVSLLDDSGREHTRLTHLSARALHSPSLATLYYQPVWTEAARVTAPGAASASDLLLFDQEPTRQAAYQSAFGGRVILVQPGERYARHSAEHYTLDPTSAQDYSRLIGELSAGANGLPTHIVHAWSQSPYTGEPQHIEEQLSHSLYALFYLSQALLAQQPSAAIHLQYHYLEAEPGDQPVYAAMSGFNKTLGRESSKLHYKSIALSDLSEAVEIALGERDQPEPEVRYSQGRRQCKQLRECPQQSADAASSALKQQGIYLITGGAGGLGLLFADYLARHYQARLMLSGRSALTAAQQQRIESLEGNGARVRYYQADIAQRAAVDDLIAAIKTEYNGLDGIFHSAGVLRDARLANKTPEDIAAVLAAKVYGSVHLDAATRDEALECFILFSSITAETGNVGQSDYAYANAYMDNLAAWRRQRVAQHQRQGKTLSINWPLWQSGGMQVDTQTATWIRNSLGLHPLATDQGMTALRTSLEQHDGAQIAILHGDRHRIAKALGQGGDTRAQTGAPERHSAERAQVHGELQQQVQATLLTLAGAILKIDRDDIDASDDISDYGFDSISFTEFANRINTTYALEVTPTLFFEYPSLAACAAHLSSQYTDSLRDHYGIADGAAGVPIANRPVQHRQAPEPQPTATSLRQGLRIEAVQQAAQAEPSARQAIAIIGMSGVMPQSPDLEQFWQHLHAGDDLISEIPPARWDWRAYDGDPTEDTQKTRAKWGGFIPDIDKFDPLFFGISPREAELMDPQHRLFLQTVWHTIEDAGYRPSALAGSKTGLFVGVATHDYEQLVRAHVAGSEAHSATGMAYSMLANRISYLLDLRGPSEPIDTACSSALVALHRALWAIRNGSCDTALVGGVNAILTPELTLSFSQAGMLSADGRCKTFDQRADGYVRGEGVGAVWLKPLQQAEIDGDPIYAVIKGSAENHGGHAASLTAPNPSAQAELIVQAVQDAQIAPESISYIEAHGTGTGLGDPIEIDGLKKAFSQLYAQAGKAQPQTPHCGIGSVKTNVGHLEAAAGMAGLFKIVLAMQHQSLPKHLHFETLNPYIDLDNSPFYIVEHNQAWPSKDDQGNPIVRRAGISSFGFGGTNAHVILEAYDQAHTPSEPSQPGEQLIVLSAKAPDRLQAQASQLLAYLERHPDTPMTRLAYSLQVGRESLNERLALVVTTQDQLQQALSAYVTGQDRSEQDLWYRGTLKAQRGQGADAAHRASLLLLEGEEGEAYLERILHNKKYTKLAQLWVAGAAIDWRLLYGASAPPRLSLPTYPFAKTRYWIGASKQAPQRAAQALASAPPCAPLPSLFATLAARLSDSALRLDNPAGSEAAIQALSAYAQDLLVDAFQRMGVFQRAGATYEIDELAAQLRLDRTHDRLYRALLEILEQAGYIVRDGATLRGTSRLEEADVQTALHELEQRGDALERRYRDDIAAHIQLLRTCVRAYPQLLSGQRAATDVLFPDASMDLVERVYKGNRLSDHYNALVVEQLRAYVSARLASAPPAAPIEILEIGAGTGGSTASLLAALAPWATHIRYHYTDISKGFTHYGKTTYGAAYPFVAFSLLDIERDIQPQGYTPHSMDVVIAANVLHATQDMHRTLRNTRALLKPRGLLILNEVTRVQPFATMTFGLLEGWWLYRDPDLRLPHSPLLSTRTWENLLRDEGFDQVDSGGLEDTMVSSLQRVMVAEANWQPAALPEQSLLQKSPIDAVMDARSTQPDRVAAGSQTVADTRRTPASAEIQALLMEQFAAVLQITADHLDLDAPFSDFGVDSILSVALIRRLNRALSIELRTTDLFNYPSIRQLAEHVLDQFGDSLVIGGDDNNEDVSAVPDASLSDILDRWLISGVLDIEEAERRIMGVINEG